MDPSKLIDWAGLTHVGRHRTSNQDAYIAVPATDPIMFQKRGHLFLVADGMGAHAAGELASKMAVDVIPLSYQKYTKVDAHVALQLAIETANENVHNRGQENLDFAGMGTTATALVLLPETFFVAHVGDSRVYRIRPHAVEQLSRDHSLAQELVQRGQLRPDQVRSFGASNVIVRSIGPAPDVEVDIGGPAPLSPGDAFLLCSDGLTRHVTDAEIGWVVSRHDAQHACQILVEMANARGGMDNITVMVARYRGLEGTAAPPPSEQTTETLTVRRPLARVIQTIQRVALGLSALCAVYVAASWPLGLPLRVLTLGAGVVVFLLWTALHFRHHLHWPHKHADPTPPPEQWHGTTTLKLEPDAVLAVGQAAAGSLHWKKSRNPSFNDKPFWQQKNQGDELVQQGELDRALTLYCDVLGCKVMSTTSANASTVTLQTRTRQSEASEHTDSPQAGDESDHQDPSG